MAMRRLVIALLSLMLLTIAAASRPQTSGTADPAKEPPQKKSKKVWTTEDLSKIRGGVSVVGEKPAPPPKAADDDAEADETEGPKVLEPESAVKVEPCLSRSWSAAVDAVLSAQGVSLGRDFWMDRFFGGDVCPPTLPGVATLAKRLDGDHFLEGGSKVKLQAVVSSGSLPANDLVALQDRGEAFVLVWRGHPYVVTNLGGVVYVSEEGSRSYKIEEIDLYDPYEDHRTKFSLKRGHVASEIDAAVEIRVTR